MTTQIKYRIPLIVRSGERYTDSDPDVLPATPQAAQRTADDFSESDLVQYSDLSFLKGLKAEAQGDKLIVTADFSKEATPIRIAKVARYLSGQCSDGWGEGFEQQELDGRALGYPGYEKVFISTWERGREVEILRDEASTSN